jgi:dTMP kinase
VTSAVNVDRARWIALEGVDGSGKSTQAERLAKEIGAVPTREPGGTPIGREVRAILLDAAHAGLAARAEALLMAADRAQHLDEVVLPALAAGRHVVSDRSAYSSLAYQGYGRGLPVDEVRGLNDWAMGGRWPDLVVLLDLPVAAAAARLAGPADRIEQAGGAFHERVRSGFLDLAAASPGRWAVVDAGDTVDAVTLAVRAAVRDRLGL